MCKRAHLYNGFSPHQRACIQQLAQLAGANTGNEKHAVTSTLQAQCNLCVVGGIELGWVVFRRIKNLIGNVICECVHTYVQGLSLSLWKCVCVCCVYELHLHWIQDQILMHNRHVIVFKKVRPSTCSFHLFPSFLF
jgi:hypothetical protein